MIPIDKLMIWTANNWKKYGPTQMNLILRIHCDQLLITSSTEIVELISMSNKIKGVYKDNALILFIKRDPNELRKIKFQVKSNASKCYEELNKYFPVVNHNFRQSNNIVTPRYLNVEDVISHVLKTKEPTNVISDLPPSFKNFVRICLLDPTFPKLVRQVQNIISNENKYFLNNYEELYTRSFTIIKN